jgi:ribosomal protein S18 acetylase RimI-like enzyme
VTTLITSIDAVGDGLQKVRKAGPGYSTNFYPTRDKLQRWVVRQELSGTESDGSLILLRRDRDFQHLYYCSAGLDVLEPALDRLLAEVTSTLVTDIVGRDSELNGPAALFFRHGFRDYARLVRLARVVAGRGPALEPAEAEPARGADADRVSELIETAFDRYAEQLPDHNEITAAIAGGSILVVREGDQLAGLLYYELTGLTAYVRYWLVAPAFRERRVGTRLMHGYFARCSTARRFILWVLAANENAILRYEHYGFRPDGLQDRVLLRGDRLSAPNNV